jgi:hypothetical protein
MKIRKSINSATNSCGIPSKPSTTIEESSGNKYLYITKHGIGPGMLPSGVKLVDSKDLSPDLTAIWVDRFLTTRELDEYDIYPETEIDSVLEKYNINETAESLSAVTSATYDDTPNKINEDYIARLIESVDRELPDTFVTYKYDEGSNMVSCTSASPTQIAEYEVPVEDLSGVIDEDMDYILGAINDEAIESEDTELVEDGRYEFIDSKTVLDFDGFNTEYTMYYDKEDGRYVFVFGDSDYYSPYDENFDWECETLEEAQEWFDSYVGPGEDIDEYSDYHDFSDWDY